MKKLTLFTAVFFISTSCFADDKTSTDTKAFYRPDFKHIYIPESVDIKGNGIIPAPIGDYSLLSPIVSIKINGQGPFRFLFDTGFSQSMISKRLAKKLKLPVTEVNEARAVTPNQVINIFQTSHFTNKIEVGDITIHNYNLIVTSGFEDEVDIFKNRQVVGVLSANSLYPKLITIDYRNEKIKVSDGQLNKKDPNVTRHKIKSTTPKIKAKLKFNKLNKTVEQNFILDTGCHANIYVNACDIPEMLKFRGRENLITYDFQGYQDNEFFAQLYGDVQLLPNYSLKSPYITFSQANCQLKRRTGLLCRKFFEKHKVTIDMVNYLAKILKY